MFEFIYKVRLSQSGENPPELSRMSEGILGTFWTRSAPGTYHFKRDRPFYNFEQNFPGNTVTEILPNGGNKITFTQTARHEFTICTFNAADLETPVDGILRKYKFKLVIPREDFRY